MESLTIDCLSGANKIQLINPANNLFGFIFWNAANARY